MAKKITPEERAKLESLFNVKPGESLCGNGGTPKSGLFVPGGDARLKSRLKKTLAEGNAKDKALATKQAKALGWDFLLPA